VWGSATMAVATVGAHVVWLRACCCSYRKNRTAACLIASEKCKLRSAWGQLAPAQTRGVRIASHHMHGRLLARLGGRARTHGVHMIRMIELIGSARGRNGVMSERRTAFRLSYSVASSFFKNFFVDFFAFPIVNTGQRSHRHSARPPAGARKSGWVLSVGSCGQHTHTEPRDQNPTRKQCVCGE